MKICSCVLIYKGKGEQIWDRWTQAGGKVRNNATGNIACDSYNRFDEDIAIMSDLGVIFKIWK